MGLLVEEETLLLLDTFDSSIRMGRVVLENVGYSLDEATDLAERFNQRDRSQMRELAEVYDPTVPAHKNPDYVAMAKKLNEEWEQEQTHASKNAGDDSAETSPAKSS